MYNLNFGSWNFQHYVEVLTRTEVLGIISIALALVWIGYIGYRVRFWLVQGRKLHERDYQPPRVTLTARVTRWLLVRLLAYRVVGRIRLIDRHHANFRGRLVVVSNHQNERDTFVMPCILRFRKYRYFISAAQAMGWRAPLVAWTGGLVVDFKNPRGPTLALRTAIKVMVREGDTSFVIFPTGELDPENNPSRERYLPGAALLTQKMAASSKVPLALLPVGGNYSLSPHSDYWYHRLLRRVGFERFRTFFGQTVYGATFVIGRRLELAELPDDAKGTTDVIFERISDLVVRAKQG